MVDKPIRVTDLVINSNLCPDCMGKGRIFDPMSIRRSQESNHLPEFTDCPRCHGTGFERTL